MPHGILAVFGAFLVLIGLWAPITTPAGFQVPLNVFFISLGFLLIVPAFLSAKVLKGS